MIARDIRGWLESRAPRSDSLIGEITRWSGALLALGLAITLLVAWLAERSTARYLADASLIDFLREEITPSIADCGPGGGACLNQHYQNETGGIWSFEDEAGRRHNSFSFAVSAFARGAEGCPRTAAREIDRFELFDCAPPGGGIGYRVALRDHPGESFALVALELSAWRRKVDRAIGHVVAWRSLRPAIIAMAVTLIGVQGLVLFALRRRLAHHFDRLGRAMDAWRLGDMHALGGDYPREIRGLVGSLDRAIRTNDELVARQRRNVAKMAHDLRHQIVTVDIAARGGEADALRAELDTFGRLIERYLTLVDWVGPAEGRPETDLSDTLEQTRKAFARRLRMTPLAVEVDCPPGLRAAIHPTDLRIILSNLMSNAHRHAAGRVRLSGRQTRDGVRLAVEDDGPGVPEIERDRILGWGERLDAALPGSGFGLTIVAEQVRELYRGDVALERSDLGGLRVSVWLPAAGATARSAPEWRS